MSNPACPFSVTCRLLAACLVTASVAGVVSPRHSAVFGQDAAARTPRGDSAAAIPEVKLLDQDVLGIAVIRAERIRQWPVFGEMRKRGIFRKPEQSLQQMFGFTVDELERAVIAVDKDLVSRIAKEAGLAPTGVKTPEPTAGDVQNKLKQIALSFHNYHSAYGRLPRADGDGAGKQSGLSWRVHILPYIEQGPLFEQFHLDEAWDSPHNKALVAKMPDFYRTPGVKDPGKTALHVFTGKGTAFDGKEGKKFQAFVDGMSNSLLTIAAAPETAVEWTKPGGLEFDPKTCRELLGKFDDPLIQAVMADGAVRPIPSTIDAKQLALLVQIDDRQQVQPFDSARPIRPAPPMPTVILTFSKAADPARPGVFPSKETVDGETVYSNPAFSLWLASERTIVVGPAESLKRLIRNQKSKGPSSSSAAANLVSEADVSVILNTSSQSSLLETAAAVSKNPLMEVFSSVTAISLQANVSQRTGGKLLEIVAVTAEEDAAENLMTAIKPSLDQIRRTLAKTPISTAQPEAEKGRGLAVSALGAAEIRRNANRVTLLIPVPEGFDTLPDIVRPLLPPNAAVDAAARSERMNNLKRVAIAFHNCHDVYGSFPGAGRPPGKDGAPVDKKMTGLSWRVHLLPYLEQDALYRQFHLDEPWDSEHNKALIEKMPDIYRTVGVEKKGHTALHVLTGKGAPFADDRAPRIREFTDGTSNTLLAVEAAPEKAEPWTKPGGLDFDPKNPLEALGTLPERTFLSILADGSVQNIAKTIAADHLRRLIQFQDGEPIR